MVVLVYATISTVLLVHQYSVQISDWDTLLVYEFITLSDRSQSSSYQGIQRCVLVQNISGVLISQGCIPLNDIWGHPDGISCLYWIPFVSQPVDALSLQQQQAVLIVMYLLDI